ncbi:putative glycoprotease family protein [Erysiphe neolycopersici]|uniref:Putative glycoprotease family protein n=1 Tax=Erysiphe neolycopersici TaxID=212602 RepID=A0A420HEC9_9PEZI|nr:putative glycoprotease family protein [Erysiphe neolycopersici]
METMNRSQSAIDETLSPKKLAQDNTKLQLKNQFRQADTDLISSLTRHQVVPPAIYERSSEYQSELSHPGSSDRSKESKLNEALVPNDSFYFNHHLNHYATPIHLQRRTSIHCWEEKKEKSKDQPILIGISIPVKRTDQEILSPQTALSSSVESPVMNSKTNAHYRYPRCQNSDVASSTSNNQDREASKLHQVEEILKIHQNYSLSNSSDSSIWIDDFLSGSARSRTTSFCTTFEEDESPILARIPESIESSRNLVNQQLRVDTIAAQRCSRGWWNYIISPFVSTSTSPPSSGQEFEGRSYSDLAMINYEKLTEPKKDNQNQKFKFTSSSKSSENNNSHLELYLKNTEVKSVTSNTPLIKRAMSGLLTTPIEASIHTSSELDPGYTRTHLSCDRKDGPSNDKSPYKLEKKPSCQSEFPDNITEISFHLNMSQNFSREKNITALCESPNKAILAGEISHKSRNHFSPALNVPPVNILPPRKKLPYPTRKYSQSSMSQKSSSLKNKIPYLQTSMMSSKPGIHISEILLSPPIRDTTNYTSSHLEIPAVSNGGNYPDKYLKDITSDKENSTQNDFTHHSSRHAGFRGIPITKSCFHDRAENRKRRKRQKQYFVLALFILFMIITTLLVTMTHLRPKRSDIQSQWLNLTEFPPIFLGSSTVISPILIRESSACVTPATQWSCHLPKELQLSIKDIPTAQPNFFIKIDWDNSTEANTTFLNPSNNRTNFSQIHAQKAAIRPLTRYSISSNSPINNFKPDPAPPLTAEQWFLGGTTDGIVSADKAGEPTPFYISFIEPVRPAIEKYKVSFIKNQFPNVSSIIPLPNLGPDGKAAPANLLSYVTNQPIKLYDRGLPTEHFGFYNYFDRSIFLKSISFDINDVKGNLSPEDLNGGAARTEASHRCTWSQTRFLVQIWTRKNSTSPVNHKCNQEKVTDINTALQQPGSFPYPITVTLDRHGGDPVTKTLYCYKLDSVGGLDANSGHINIEFRGSGGVLINPAPTIFTNISDSKMGGYDGGDSGCICQWSNFHENLI